MLYSKIISSLEKFFPTSKLSDFPEHSELTVLLGERVSFQFIAHSDHTFPRPTSCEFYTPQVSGAPAKSVQIRTVECIPSRFTTRPDGRDDNYLNDAQPGLYPDLLQPIHNDGRMPITRDIATALWIDFVATRAGNHKVKVTLTDGEGNVAAEQVLKVRVINEKLPEQELKLTQWFHGDCLATYYDCHVFSKKWWTVVKNFIKTAVDNGINMILTPTFTPPLDTQIGGERPTVQLVDVTVENGKYTFGWDRLDRWIDMCDKLGVKYFEIAHFFTQWGAYHAPKVMATVDGEFRRIFGWETDAAGEEYVGFLRAFITAFLDHMKARGDDKRCFFHISDEPNMDHLEQYLKDKNAIADLLEGYTIMDALSNYEFYRDGVVETPIPANNHIKPFLEANVKGLWTYYCCSQAKDVSNRFFAMPSWRNRCIGAQLFKFDIDGFLHWGYNFYYSRYSANFVNPFIDSSSEYAFPSGDPYSVYPAHDLTAMESLRIVVFHEALQDLRAMKLCAKYYGKDFVVSEIEKICGEVAFDRCPTEAAPVLAVRARINELIDLQVSRRTLAKKYLGKTVKIDVDRPVGYTHVKGEKTLHYPINYGYIKGVLGGDGEELDVYLMGVSEPVKSAKCRIIGIVRRENDVEDKLIGAPEGMDFTAEEMAAAVNFQEKYYVSRIETL
ncbi:MAG: DUF4091 domain-containing protein [Clostridia bacterium]|nr:DUF4091 domain-containing protein [Clostridia bacterium]